MEHYGRILINELINDIDRVYYNRDDNETFLVGTIPIPNLWTVNDVYDLVFSEIKEIYPDIEDRWTISIVDSDKPYICLIRDDDPDELANIVLN